MFFLHILPLFRYALKYPLDRPESFLKDEIDSHVQKKSRELIQNLERYRKIDEKDYTKYFKTYIWYKVFTKILRKQEPKTGKTQKPLAIAQLQQYERQDPEEMNKRTFGYALAHTYYFYMFSEIVKLIFLPAKDIFLLTVRIRFVKAFDIPSFSLWIGLELLFPILVQQIEVIDSLKKKYINKSIQKLIFNKSMKIQVQSEGTAAKSKTNRVKKFKKMKMNRKNKDRSMKKQKKILKGKLKIKGKEKIDYKNKIEKTKQKTTNYLKESEILTMYHEDAKCISQKPFVVLRSFRSLLKTLYSFIYAFLVFGYSTFVFLLGILLAVYASKKLFSIWGKLNQKNRDIRETKMAYMLSMLKNFRLMKIWRLENIVFYNIEKLNLKESDQNQESWKLRFFITVVSGLTAVGITSIFIFLYLLNGGVIEATNILVLLQLFDKSARSSAGIMLLVENLDAVKLSIERIVRMLNIKESKEVTFTKNVRLAEEMKSEFGVEIENCKYFWKKKKVKESKNKLLLSDQDSNKSENSEVSEQSDSVSLNSSFDETLKKIDNKSKKREYFELNVEEFRAKKGSLTTIIGKMGSGKSSLLKAIMGEMPCDLDSVDEDTPPKAIIRGKIGYCSQIPLMLNDTVKKNILLGRQYIEKRFKKCLQLSCLEHDISTWEEGLEHIVGFQGSSISGGQKIRIALARCLYTECDVYFFDDVTSALDNRVGSYILERTILGHLKDKTIIMVTNNMNCLPKSDKIVLMRHGRIAKQGSFEEMQNLELWNRYLEIMGSWKATEEQTGVQSESEERSRKMSLVQEESPAPSNFKISAKIENLFKKQDYSIKDILRFLIFSVNSLRNLILVAFLLCLQAFLNASRTQKLSKWSTNFKESTKYQDLKYFMLISVIAMMVQLACGKIIQRQKSKIVRSIKARMFYKTLHGQLENFLDIVPAHEIVNIINEGAGVILGMIMEAANILRQGMKIFIFFFYVKLAMGWMNYSIAVLYAMIYFFSVRIQLKISTDINKFLDKFRSQNPDILGLVLANLTEIRCMNLESYIFSRYEETEKINQRALETIKLSRWCHRFYNKYLGRLLIEIPLYISAFRNPEILDVIGVPVLMYYSKTIQRTIEKFIYSYSTVQRDLLLLNKTKNFVEMEHEDGYGEQVAKGIKIFGNGDHENLEAILEWDKELKKNCRIGKGVIEFRKVHARYQNSRDDVLKGISFKIEGGKKIGFIGRTGSGKSTIMKLLWKYMHPSQGQILLDGVDYRDLGNYVIRSHLAIVTQDINLVEGSILSNIFPKLIPPSLKILGKEKKKKLLKILEKLEFVKHFSPQKTLKMINWGLQTEVNYEELSSVESLLEKKININSTNFSKGQCQMLSFIRALMSDSRLLLLDEATSSIDILTEKNIEELINYEVRKNHKAVVVIAHRMETVKNCDLIYKLGQKGRIVDQGTWDELNLGNQSSFNEINQ